jgi:mono/diheme cytochrome c family protein
MRGPEEEAGSRAGLIAGSCCALAGGSAGGWGGGGHAGMKAETTGSIQVIRRPSRVFARPALVIRLHHTWGGFNMIKKVLLGLLGAVVLLVCSFVAYVQLSYDKSWNDEVPVPDLKASTDPEVIARGAYLVRGPAHCSNCHVDTFANFAKADRGEDIPLKGGIKFPMGPVGAMYVRNLTSDKETGLGRYSDGQIFRLLRHAVRPNGKATIGLMMPFQKMADEDLIAIVSYLRTLPPVKNEVPENEWTFMGKAVKTLAPPFQPILDPQPVAKAPAMAETKERGEYLSRYVANCYGCHTQHDEVSMERIGPEHAGGSEMEPMPFPGVDPTLWTRAPNLTPIEGGVLKTLGTREAWIERFRKGRVHPQSPMHWGPFSRMTDEDLGALWVYFNSLSPTEHAPGSLPQVFAKEP